MAGRKPLDSLFYSQICFPDAGPSETKVILDKVAKPDGQTRLGSWDIMFLFCHVISCSPMIKGMFDLVSGSP